MFHDTVKNTKISQVEVSGLSGVGQHAGVVVGQVSDDGISLVHGCTIMLKMPLISGPKPGAFPSD